MKSVCWDMTGIGCTPSSLQHGILDHLPRRGEAPDSTYLLLPTQGSQWCHTTASLATVNDRQINDNSPRIMKIITEYLGEIAIWDNLGDLWLPSAVWGSGLVFIATGGQQFDDPATGRVEYLYAASLTRAKPTVFHPPGSSRTPRRTTLRSCCAGRTII